MSNTKATKPARKGTAKPAAAPTPELAKSAKLRAQRKAKANADTIIVSKGLATGNGTYVENGAGKNVIVAQWQDRGATRKLSAVGASFATLQAHLATLVKPAARLAQGVTPQNSPQSAKAVEDARKGGAKPAATGKGGKGRTAKADKAKAPSRGTNRKYSKAGRKDESKPDTFRRYMLTTIMAHKDTDSAKAAHAKSKQYPTHKLDFNWSAQQGYIKFAD